MGGDLLAIQSTILIDLKRDGFSVCPRLNPELTTFEIGSRLGKILDVAKLLPGSGIPLIQTLTPRNISEVRQNQYSGNYGFAEFPLHTDLAHWASPPRYFVLRCIVGSEDVFTHILPSTEIVGLIGPSTLRRAVFSARKQRVGYSGLFRALSSHGGLDLFRWDPIFLRPVNANAQQVGAAVSNSDWRSKIQRVLLEQYGDTLVVDNWRILHGRAAVAPRSISRRIERVYLSEVDE